MNEALDSEAHLVPESKIVNNKFEEEAVFFIETRLSQTAESMAF